MSSFAHLNTSSSKPGRALVLGARGFIGRAVIRRLEAERIGVRPVTSSELDLTSPSSTDALATMIRRDDAILMLAALTPDKGRDIGTAIRNLTMMQHVCASLERTACAHLVYFSSDAVYGSATTRVTEDTAPSPQNLYGSMHLAREIMAQSLAGTPVLVLRPTLVYGSEDTHNAYGPNRFRRSARKEGRIQLFGEGEEKRDHIHVDDAASITAHCLMRRTTGTLNLATGTSTSFRDVAELVAGQFGRAIEIISTPRANPVTHRHYDVTNLIKAFPGYRFIALPEGIERSHRESKGDA